MDPHQPLLRDTPLDDQQLVRYLLGLLPPHEADRFDEASVVDDAVAARLRGVEDDLVDAYVRGTLAIDLRERFESHYLASPRRRERVAFAAAFARAVDERPRPAAVPSWRPRWTPALLPALAIAAVLLLVASAGLLFESVRLGRGLSLAESDRAALDRRARDLERQNADLRTANADIAQQLALARTPVAAAAQDVRAIALVLLPQTRSVGAVPVLDLPAAPADRVSFELRLEANEFNRYQVGLRDPTSNAVVWRSDWVGAKTSAEGASVRVAVPRSLLKPQHYTLDLAGRSASDTAHVVGSYAFEVTRR
jgi:hypothetical protein